MFGVLLVISVLREPSTALQPRPTRSRSPGWLSFRELSCRRRSRLRSSCGSTIRRGCCVGDTTSTRRTVPVDFGCWRLMGRLNIVAFIIGLTQKCARFLWLRLLVALLEHFSRACRRLHLLLPIRVSYREI